MGIMHLIDPHGTSDPLYECEDCGVRLTRELHVRVCPECGGFLRNIGIARGE